jgi:hypothetical protein
MQSHVPTETVLKFSCSDLQFISFQARTIGSGLPPRLDKAATPQPPQSVGNTRFIRPRNFCCNRMKNTAKHVRKTPLDLWK